MQNSLALHSTGKAKKLRQITEYYSAMKKNWITSVSGNVMNLTNVSLMKETKDKRLYVQPFHLNDYAKDKTWGTKTICRVAREGKEGDWLQRSTKKLYVVPEVFWGQLSSSAYCQHSNILYCDCAGHTSVCVCQNRGRLVILWVLYKSNAFPGSWLKHCALCLSYRWRVEGVLKGLLSILVTGSSWLLGLWKASGLYGAIPREGKKEMEHADVWDLWVSVWEGCQKSSFLSVAPSWRTVLSSRRRNSIPTACQRSQGREAIWDTKAVPLAHGERLPWCCRLAHAHLAG